MKVVKTKTFILLILFLSLPFCTFFNLYAQKSNRSKFELFQIEQPEDVPSFRVDFLNVAAEDPNLSRVIFKLTFVNDALQFIKFKKKKFRADYEATVVILDSGETEVDRLKKSGFVVASTFDETNSVDIKNSTKLNLDLPPGSYKFQIYLKDVETQRSGQRNGAITLRDFAVDGLVVSDFFIVDSLMAEQTNGELASTRSTDIEPQRKWFAYFEIYHVPESDSIDIAYEIMGSEGNVVQTGEHKISSRGRATQVYLPLEELALVSRQHRIKLHLKSREKYRELEQPLSISDSEIGPAYINLEEAVEQLVYIAKDKELERMKSLSGPEKQKAFEEFWLPRDPDLSTRMNEYRDEYYRRIKFANKRFARDSHRPGWKTEMGMVYIKLGPPDYVNTSYGSYSRSFYDDLTNLRRKPIIIWQYYSLRKQVIFQYKITEYRIANYSEVFDVLNDEMYF